jgi:hypothetical protein
MEKVDDAELATELTDKIESARERRHEALLEKAINDQDQAISRFEKPSYRPAHPIPFEDSIYRLSWEAIDDGVWIDAETIVGDEGGPVDAGNSTSSDDTGQSSGDTVRTIPFSELPAVDRERMDTVLSQLTADAFDAVERLVVYDDTDRENSVLVPDQGYAVVVAEDRDPADPVRIRIRPEDRTVYRATARERLVSDATYGEQLRQYYGIELGSLSEAEQGIVEEAIHEEYTPGDEESDQESDEESGESATDSDPFRSISERLVPHEPVVQTLEGSWWPVRWQGDVYLTSLHLTRYQELERRLQQYEPTPGERHGPDDGSDEDRGRTR